MDGDPEAAERRMMIERMMGPANASKLCVEPSAPRGKSCVNRREWTAVRERPRRLYWK